MFYLLLVQRGLTEIFATEGTEHTEVFSLSLRALALAMTEMPVAKT